jgi:hypothetical protein
MNPKERHRNERARRRLLKKLKTKKELIEELRLEVYENSQHK